MVANTDTKNVKFTVRYPSGKEFEVVGRFELLAVDDQMVPFVFLQDTPSVKDRAVALDPRAIVTCGDCQIYSPKENPRLSESMAKWMSAHPGWG